MRDFSRRNVRANPIHTYARICVCIHEMGGTFGIRSAALMSGMESYRDEAGTKMYISLRALRWRVYHGHRAYALVLVDAIKFKKCC